MPLPINLASIAKVAVQLDFIRKSIPVEPAGTIGAPLVDLGYQRQEPGILDSKMRWQTLVFPFRMIYTSLAGLAYLRSINQAWEKIPSFDFNSNPSTPGLGWGAASTLDTANSPDGSLSLDPFAGAFWAGTNWGGEIPITFGNYAHFWLYSVVVDNAALVPGGAPNLEVQIMQFLAVTPLNYEIWKVTLRDPVSAQGDYLFENGFQPAVYPPITSQVPWARSSDFAKVSEGFLKAGDVFTLLPHDTDPRTNAQVPPAGTFDGVHPVLPPVDTYWAGWGVANFMIFV